MEKLRYRVDKKLVSNKKVYLKWTSKRSYTSQKLFDNYLVAIHKSKVTLKLNKPAYVGMCILNVSKVLMYEFHYDWIKNKYGNSSGLLLADNDSLMYEIKTEDANEDFSEGKEMFDFSNYPAKSKCYDDLNKLVVGKLKDEIGGVAIEEFVRLKPKVYSFLGGDSSIKK